MNLNWTSAALVGLGLVAAPAALAQDYPSRPINIVVGFDAGGSVDRLARGLAPYLSAELGQPVTVENRPGAGGQVGTTWFLQQPADGYTLMVSPATPYLPTNILVTGASYTLDDFTFINGQWTDFAFLAVPVESPYQTAAELIDAIKANPGELSAGVTFGSAGHISTLVLLDALGLDQDAIRLVTFDGGGSLRTGIAGAQVDFSIVQAEGSETIADFIRPLAVYLTEPRDDFDAPLINDVLQPLGVEVPVLSGSVRTLISPAGFKADHPEDYQVLVDAYRAALENPEFQAWLAQNEMAGDWIGEERTTEIIRTSFDVLDQYKELLAD
jgi:tripartite-type tricarboxylate transporter receptor subunit TctC